MTDPHVQTLHYRVEPDKNFVYEKPPPVRVTTPEFEAVLKADRLVARMLQHYPTESDARLPTDAFLRAWEIAAGIARARPELRFVFEQAEIIDRAPPRPGDVRTYVSGMKAILSASGSLTTHTTSSVYPQPPRGFSVTPLIEVLWRRYQNFLEGREPLFAMAYFCLTAIERDAGDRKRAAKKFNIDPKVLSKLGELSSVRGDESNARKAMTAPRPATGAETAWVEASIRAFIKHVGAAAALSKVAKLTMAALPRL